MNLLTHVDLRDDPKARLFIKDETVMVTFATEAGSVSSREGANRYAKGDAIIVGSTGGRWSVSRDRFDLKYTPVSPLIHGQKGAYRNKPIPVLAKQIAEEFAVERSQGGDIIRGRACDWLLQYAPNDLGIVEDEKFRRVYRTL